MSKWRSAVRELVHYATAAPVVVPDAKALGIAIVGAGRIAREAHLPAYAKAGFNVVGIYDPAPEAIELARRVVPVQRVYRSLHEILEDPKVCVVDVATHADVRAAVMVDALESGKHVLGQKPFTTCGADAVRVVQKAKDLGLKVAVNVNGRWAPAWRATTNLVEAGAIGKPFSVSHLYETSFAWTVGTRFNEMPHFGLGDYSVHWIDIGLRWLRPLFPGRVWAREARLATQPPASQTPWSVDVNIEVGNGASVGIRGVGGAAGRTPSHPYVVHGQEGSIRGGVLRDRPIVLELEEGRLRVLPEGSWFPDAFAGSMAELLMAIVHDREPDHGARDGLRTISATVAAVASAVSGGVPVAVENLVAVSETETASGLSSGVSAV
jgi:predicted dehydrogenase